MVEFWVATNYGDGEGTIAFTANAAGHKLALSDSDGVGG